MFTHQQIEHFKAFGFVVARRLFTEAETSALTAEVAGALTEAFGGSGTDDDPDATGGIRGDYLPLALDRTPFSQSLMADDPRLFQGSTELLGQMTVPTVPIATCFTSNAGWHPDHGPGIRGLKFLAHLEPRTAATGALRVLPGSHTPGYAERLQAYWAQDPGAPGFEDWPVPGVVVETSPGDVIAFDAHLIHASEGGEKRMAWTIEYLVWSENRSRVRDAVVDMAAIEAWAEWAAEPAPAPASRQTAIQRLRILGVLR
jgi:hypothetical protein